MLVREPNFDFSKTPVHWANPPEFAQSMNAMSTNIPHLERFLNRVMVKAKAQIAGDDSQSVALRGDIATFIRQESCHYRAHESFNAILARGDYDRLAEFEAEAIEHYNRLLRTKSLGFLCAYCEGFETLGPPSAVLWLDKMDPELVGADGEAVRLIKWHVMEEYEHRTVCHDVFKRIHGGYFMRVYGLLYQAAYLKKYTTRVTEYLLEVDRRGMTPEQIKKSKRAQAITARRARRRTLFAFLKALSPFYDPRRTKVPENFSRYRIALERDLGLAN